MVNVADDRDDVRLDVWLDVACVFRTRSEAQKACRGGKVEWELPAIACGGFRLGARRADEHRT